MTTKKTALATAWPIVSKETLEEFLFSQCKNEISDEQKALFIGIATAHQLNPFKREIYPIPFWNTKLGKSDMQPVIAYNVFLQRAQASGELDGWKTEIYENEEKKVTWGKIIIYRKDRSHPFEWEVFREEIVQTKKDGTINKNWLDKPRFMTRKTLIGQGMRLCFPDHLGGLPYLEEEVHGAIIDADKHTTPLLPSLPKSKEKNLTITDVSVTQPTNGWWLRVQSVKKEKEVTTAK